MPDGTSSLQDSRETLRVGGWAQMLGQALRGFWCGAVLGASAVSLAVAAPAIEVCVLIGAAGEATFAEGFADAAQAWEKAAARGGASVTLIGLADAESEDREQLRKWLEARRDAGGAPVWLVYLGHGSFDGRDARLNLRGPDLMAAELAEWLQPVQRSIVVVHGGSAAAPFLHALSAPERIIITATRSGHEVNYARFGERFAEAIASPSADIDQDGQTSLLEAFVTAAQQVQAFYAENGRLATEHALIDDNGDRHGTPAEWFRGTRVQRRPQDQREPDGDRARLIALVPTPEEQQLDAGERARRDRLEQQLAALRVRKAELAPEEYDRELERLLRQLAAIYRVDS